MPHFHPKHIPSLFVATTFTFGGMVPFYDTPGAIRAYGLPEHIAISPTAHPPFIIYGARMTMLGALLWIFYLQGKLKEVDTILALVLYFLVADAWVWWREGVLGDRWIQFKFIFGALLGFWGALGMTGSGRH